MAEKSDQPGAVPTFMPHQVTAPLPLHQGPWMYPPPPSDPKKDEPHGGIKLAIQIIMAALALGGVVFAAGVAREKLNNIEANQKAETGLRADQKRAQDERDENVTRTLERLGRKVDALAEQVTQARPTRRVRRHDTSDQVLPPGP